MTASFLKNTSLYRILTVIRSADVLTFLVFSPKISGQKNQLSEKTKEAKLLKVLIFFLVKCLFDKCLNIALPLSFLIL